MVQLRSSKHSFQRTGTSSVRRGARAVFLTVIPAVTLSAASWWLGWWLRKSDRCPSSYYQTEGKRWCRGIHGPFVMALGSAKEYSALINPFQLDEHQEARREKPPFSVAGAKTGKMEALHAGSVREW